MRESARLSVLNEKKPIHRLILMTQRDRQTLRALRIGWCLGADDYKKQLLEQIEGKLGR